MKNHLELMERQIMGRESMGNDCYRNLIIIINNNLINLNVRLCLSFLTINM